MRILLIPDKFKGSLTAQEVIFAISQGIRLSRPQAKIRSLLASDGGDGFLQAVAHNSTCMEIEVDSVDPLGREIRAPYIIGKDGVQAYIEMAQTSGLELLKPHERQTGETSTLGTGVQLKHALGQGVREIYLGLGGSATTDGGIGIAHALGFRFLDAKNDVLEPLGKNLGYIAHIAMDTLIRNPKEVAIYAVNDVDNPLYGPNGAAYVYGPQKGANDSELSLLDQGLRNLDRVVQDVLGKKVAQVPGSGAAGGTAYGLKAFLGADYVPGIDFILGLSNIKTQIRERAFDLIITGEGKLDHQTLHGKLIKGVTDLGRENAIPVVVVCGQCTLTEEEKNALGLQAILEIRDYGKPLEYSLQNAAPLIREAVRKFMGDF
ncbi:MAG: glycerate kinase [Bacteroidota bacterium]